MFDRIFKALAGEGTPSDCIMIDSTCEIARNSDPLMEWAPGAGQDHAAVLTVCRGS